MASSFIWRSGGSEVGFTGAEHVRTKVQALLANETRSGQHVRKLRASDVYVSGSDLRFAAKSIKSPCTSVALGPTDVKERDATHFGFERQAWAKSCSISSKSGWSSSQYRMTSYMRLP